jgi:hypothetical protein
VLGDGIEEEVRRGVVEEEAGPILFMRRVGQQRSPRSPASSIARQARSAWGLGTTHTDAGTSPASDRAKEGDAREKRGKGRSLTRGSRITVVSARLSWMTGGATVSAPFTAETQHKLVGRAGVKE